MVKVTTNTDGGYFPFCTPNLAMKKVKYPCDLSSGLPLKTSKTLRVMGDLVHLCVGMETLVSHLTLVAIGARRELKKIMMNFSLSILKVRPPY